VRKSLLVTGFSALALLLVPVGAAFGPERGTGPSIKRFAVLGVHTREQRSQLVAEGYDIGEAYWADRVELYGTDKQALALSLRGFQVVPRETTDDFPPGDSNYHNYAEMVADMQAVAAAHPATVHLFSLGTSYEDRNLIGARISNDASDNLSEPGAFFVGQHHAREHLSVEVVLSLLHLFAESNAPGVTRLVNTRQIYIVPSLNPDGSEYDIATGSYRLWRKNRQPNGGGSFGTDQNRNYSYNWGCCGGSSPSPSGETYRGPSALSTPEDARMAEFMIAHPNVTTGISYHSYGDLILYPYGYTYTDIPPDMSLVDHQTFVAMGAEMQRTAGYHAQQSSDLYITDGDWNDWMYGALHRYPITVELSGGGFYPGDEIIPSESARNHQAAIFVAAIADCPTKVAAMNRTRDRRCPPTSPVPATEQSRPAAWQLRPS
jgi:carboxypeptidase T